MGKEWSQTQKKPRGWWWKAPLIVVSLLAITLFVLVVNINSIALSQINSALEKFLSTGGHLENFDLQLLDGKLTLSELTLNPPEGFGPIAPLSMKSIKLEVETDSLLDQTIIVNEVVLEELAITLVRDKQGELSIVHILPNDTKPEVDASKDKSKEPLSIPAVQVKHIRINSLTLKIVDRLIGEKWAANASLDLAIDNLQLNDVMNRDIFFDDLNFTISELNIDQIPGFGQAPLLLLDNISLTANDLNLNSPHLALNSLWLKGLAISVEQSSNRVSNIERLIASWQPETNNSTVKHNTKPIDTKPIDTKPTDTKPTDTKPARTSIPPISINDIKLDTISAQLLSNATPQQWRTGFERLDIQLTDFNIAQNNITLNNAALTLKGVEVDQAPEFGDEKLLSLKQLSISIDQLNTAAEELLINKITLQALSSSIQTNAKGLSNIQALSEALIGKPELEDIANTDISTAEAATEEVDHTPQKPMPIIKIEHFLLNNSSLTYSDAAIAGKPMTFPLNNIELEAKQLRLFDDNPQAAPASISLDLELTQPNSLPNAYIGATAIMGPVTAGIPAINSQIRIGGFKLDTIEPLIPPASRTALGADGFDAAAAIALNHHAINLNASVLSDQNISYNAISIKGPVTSPTIEMGAILAGVYSRFSDGLLNLGKGGFNAGLDIASSSVDIAEAVGSGTLNMGKNLGKGLFETGSGLITLDQQQLSQGLLDSSKGTLGIGLSSVEKTGSAAKGGVKGSYEELGGSSTLRTWDEGIKPRYELSMQQAESALSQMPYPPAIR